MVDELSDRKNAECTISACTDRNTITPSAINILPEPIFIEQSQPYEFKHQLVRDAPADKTAHQMYLCSRKRQPKELECPDPDVSRTKHQMYLRQKK